jgi:hypothetical protein
MGLTHIYLCLATTAMGIGKLDLQFIKTKTAEALLLTRSLAIWRGDEYIFNFLFAFYLQFHLTNKAEQ